MTDEEKQMAAFFNSCAERGVMAGFDHAEGSVALRQVERWNIGPGERILEAGCGSGRLTLYLSGKIGREGEILAMDLAPVMIEKAQRHGLPHNIHFVVGSVKAVARPDGWFDKIICFNVFPHFDEREKIFAEFHRVLKQKGELWITHTKNRDALNALHRGLTHVVNRHELPARESMQGMLQQNGFRVEDLVDDPGEGYILRARKGGSDA